MAKQKYNNNFPLLAEDFARKGMIDKEICKKLGIGKSAYYEYQLDHPEFLEAIKRGKVPVDVEVENLLLKRARGYTYEETTVEFKKDSQGKIDKKKPTLVRKATKQVVPDVTAQIFWLKNRRPDSWKDKHDLKLTEGVEVTVISATPRPGDDISGKKKRTTRAQKK